jgi:hypothetical protein
MTINSGMGRALFLLYASLKEDIHGVRDTCLYVQKLIKILKISNSLYSS